MTKKVILAVLLSVLCLQIPAYADMGAIVPYPIKVNEEAQKAIIFHNGRQEVLILGTDLNAGNETSIIRFIPFPSEPKVSLVNADVFKVASSLMKKYKVVFITRYKGLGAATSGPGAAASAVEISLHKRIGAHDVTVIKVNKVFRFRNWVNEFFEKKGLPQRKTYPFVEGIVNNYVKRGIKYFVFDFVKVTKKIRSVAPLAYRFKSDKIYYPLITSNSFGALSNEIDLIFITPKTLFKPGSFYNKNYKFLDLPKPVNGAKGYWNVSTSSYVPKKEIKVIYPKSNEFFNYNKHLIMQFVGYRGIYDFNEDIYSDFSRCSPYTTGYPIGSLSSLILRFSVIFLNKPGIEFKLKTLPRSWIDSEKLNLNLDRLHIGSKYGIPMIRLGKIPGRRIVSVSSSVDLSRWFKNKKCAKSWDSFYKCLNKHENPEDEKLYQRIDREFYSILICQKGCKDKDFLKWKVHWYSPGYIVISAPIGEKGGFRALKDAKTSLRKINLLLKKVVYGASFPEDYGKGRTPNEVFSTSDTPIAFDYSKAVLKLLNDLIREKFLIGLSPEDVEKISAASKAGRAVLFIGKDCPSNPNVKQKGWVSLYNTVWVDFRSPFCPVR